MKVNQLPLLELFTKLREAGLPLGIDEYQLALQAIQAGFGMPDRSALSRLCCSLWVKSPEEKLIFDKHFEQLIPEKYSFLIDEPDISETDTVESFTPNFEPEEFQPEIEAIQTEPENVNEAPTTVQSRSRRKRFSEVVERLDRKIGRYVIRWVIVIAIISGFSLLIGLNFRVRVTKTQTSLKEENEISLIERVSEIGTAIVKFIMIILVRLLTIIPVPYAAIIFVISSGTLLFVLLLRVIRTRIKKDEFSIPVIENLPKEKSPPLTSEEDIAQATQDELQFAVNQLIEASGRLKSDLFLRAKEYSPITRRQMKQGWRYLRRLVREGPETELDLEETVKQIGHQGFLLKPILIPPRINRTKLILLVDQDGSMRPFHKLSSRLAETARLAGRLGKADIYYFHNCPDKYIYHDPLLLEGESIDDFLKQSSSRQTVALIFSDAGAARGGDNRERIELTHQFLDKLRSGIRYLVWLNPMPCKRWVGTTAAEIAQLVPMFEVNRQGFLGAINVLRGR